MLGLLGKAGGKIRQNGSLAGGAVRAHNESEAVRIIGILGAELGLPDDPDELTLLKKSDSRKIACAAVVKARTSVSNDWIVQRLAMGHPASMSQMVNRMQRDPMEKKQLKGYEKTLETKD